MNVVGSISDGTQSDSPCTHSSTSRSACSAGRNLRRRDAAPLRGPLLLATAREQHGRLRRPRIARQAARAGLRAVERAVARDAALVRLAGRLRHLRELHRDLGDHLVEAAPFGAVDRGAGRRNEVAAGFDEIVGDTEAGRTRGELGLECGRNERGPEAVRTTVRIARRERYRVEDGRADVRADCSRRRSRIARRRGGRSIARRSADAPRAISDVARAGGHHRERRDARRAALVGGADVLREERRVHPDLRNAQAEAHAGSRVERLAGRRDERGVLDERIRDARSPCAGGELRREARGHIRRRDAVRGAHRAARRERPTDPARPAVSRRSACTTRRRHRRDSPRPSRGPRRRARRSPTRSMRSRHRRAQRSRATPRRRRVMQSAWEVPSRGLAIQTADQAAWTIGLEKSRRSRSNMHVSAIQLVSGCTSTCAHHPGGKSFRSAFGASASRIVACFRSGDGS